MEKARLIVSLGSTLTLGSSYVTQYLGLQNESQSCVTDESQHECFSLTSYGGFCSKRKKPVQPNSSSSSVPPFNLPHETQRSLQETGPYFGKTPVGYENPDDRKFVAQSIQNGRFDEYERLLKQDGRFAMLGKSCEPHSGINAAHMVICGLDKIEYTFDKIDEGLNTAEIQAGLNCLREIKRLAPQVLNDKTGPIPIGNNLKQFDLVEYAEAMLVKYTFNLIKNQLSDLVSDGPPTIPESTLKGRL